MSLHEKPKPLTVGMFMLITTITKGTAKWTKPDSLVKQSCEILELSA